MSTPDLTAQIERVLGMWRKQQETWGEHAPVLSPVAQRSLAALAAQALADEPLAESWTAGEIIPPDVDTICTDADGLDVWRRERDALGKPTGMWAHTDLVEETQLQQMAGRVYRHPHDVPEQPAEPEATDDAEQAAHQEVIEAAQDILLAVSEFLAGIAKRGGLTVTKQNASAALTLACRAQNTITTLRALAGESGG